MKTISAFLLATAVLALGGCSLSGDARTAGAEAAPSPQSACVGQPLRKVLVTAFPLRYPEQLKSGEYMGWAQTTGEELARLLGKTGRLRVAAAAESFPFDEASAAPEVERNAQGTPRIVEWARRERAQYVLAGVFRDFGTAKKWLVASERQIDIEAYLYDGIDGRLLARHAFGRQLMMDGALPKGVSPGTHAFSNTRLGQAYNALLAEVGRWAADQTVCQPFPLRITRVDGLNLHFDAGRDSGLATGTALSTTTRAQTVLAGGSLNRKHMPIATLREVDADYSVAEVAPLRNPPTFRVGDVLYVPDK